MSPSKVTFLGTGTSQGIPMIACACSVCQSTDERDKRLRVSIHVEIGGKSFIIDTGPDFRQQVLRAGIKRLDAILYTHEHKDHTAGMDDVRGFNFHQQATIPLYARAQVIEQLKREFSYAFGENKYPGVPEIDVYEINGEPFTVQGIDIQPVFVKHYYLDVLGFRFGNFAYVTDANSIAPEEQEKLKGLDVLVINALRKTSHISHYTLAEALDLIADLKPKQAYITHISHQMGLHEEVNKELPANVSLAHDGLVLNF
jgi:phosphoribosyl 1,2-cyclic phosphate phosphodiesterase